jgi:phosphoribosyl-ATP pyrophosphohydrolase
MASESRPHLERMMQIARNELKISKEQYFVDRANSVIAYEASNHYYYTPLDLIEKMLNCDYVERELKSRLATTSSQRKR